MTKNLFFDFLTFYYYLFIEIIVNKYTKNIENVRFMLLKNYTT